MQRPLTFASFVAVAENSSALAAVERMVAGFCSKRQQCFDNPLYLHGPTGTGKSHLASAMIDSVSRHSGRSVITSLRSSDWETVFPPDTAGRSEEPETIEAIRQCDLFVVEDLQHFSPARAKELALIFDFLQARHVPMVFTATVGPKQLPLPARLTSRLACGLVVGLEPLQSASRLVLLQEKAQRRQLAVRTEILQWLAQHLSGGGRQLEGALARLETLSRTQRRHLDVETVAEHFRDDAEIDRPTVERIARRVGSHFNVHPREIRSEHRGRNVLLPRQISMYLSRKLTKLSLEQIGAYFGGRDHSTVLHACRKVEQALGNDSVLSGTVRQLYQDLA